MRFWTAILCGVGLSTAAISVASAAPCKDKPARIVKRTTSAGKVKGKLQRLRKKDGKTFAFNTTHYAYHRSELSVRWPKGMRAKDVGSLVIDVVAKPLSQPDEWSFEVRDFRSHKWVKMGALSWKDGGGDKTYALRTVDVNFYRNVHRKRGHKNSKGKAGYRSKPKRGSLLLRVRSAKVGELHIDQLQLSLGCK